VKEQTVRLIRKHRAPARPLRTPHPDPQVEAGLQRIISLREAAGRQGDLARQYAGEIAVLSGQYRKQLSHGYQWKAKSLERRIKSLQHDIRTLEEEISRINDEVIKYTAELDDTDLSYL
jgi:septal ring factor EnvC (AmiA/AmiB activator)